MNLLSTSVSISGLVSLLFVVLPFVSYLAESSASISYRVPLNSTWDMKIAISGNGNKIAIAQSKTKKILLFALNPKQKQIQQSYSYRQIASNFAEDWILYTKIHLNDQGTNLYYNNTQGSLTLLRLDGLDIVRREKVQTSCYLVCLWTAVDDVLVMFDHDGYLRVFEETVCKTNTANQTWSYNYDMININLLKSPRHIISQYSDRYEILNLDQSFNIGLTNESFTYMKTDDVVLLVKSLYFYNQYSKQIWRIAELYPTNVNNQLKTEILIKINKSGRRTIQYLNQGNQLFVSGDNKYMVILNNFASDKSVLRMYNIQQITKENGLSGVAPDLHLIDLCKIIDLRINLNGDKIVYTCKNYYQLQELVVVVHELGVPDVIMPCYNFQMFFRNSQYCGSYIFNFVNTLLVGFFIGVFTVLFICFCILRCRQKRRNHQEKQQNIYGLQKTEQISHEDKRKLSQKQHNSKTLQKTQIELNQRSKVNNINDSISKGIGINLDLNVAQKRHQQQINQTIENIRYKDDDRAF